MLAFQKAKIATDRAKPHPWPIEVFLSAHPRALKYVKIRNRRRQLATEAFYGNTAFLFVNEKGLKQAGRYQILPIAGQHYLTVAEAKAQSPNFLSLKSSGLISRRNL